jgi:hypothetical protein
VRRPVRFIAVLCALATVPTTAGAERKLALTDDQRVEAIRDAFGLGCAVQDRSTERAFAWASAAMGAVTALQATSAQASSDFAGVFYSTEQGTHARGGFNCSGFPQWPNQPGPSTR